MCVSVCLGYACVCVCVCGNNSMAKILVRDIEYSICVYVCMYASMCVCM